MRRLSICAAAAVLATGCADSVVVNSGSTPPRTETPAPTTTTGRTDPVLVNAADYYVTADGLKGYYFTTPNGKWSCAILPHSRAGCQAASGALGIPGEPDTVENAGGEAIAPNAIAVADQGEPGFTWLAPPGFSVRSGEAQVLDFNKTLAAAGFRCNAQEAGVSCLNETTKKGFTFSPNGLTPHYTAVPG